MPRPSSVAILKTLTDTVSRQRVCHRCLATQASARDAPSPYRSSFYPARRTTKTPYGIMHHKARQIKAIPSPPSTARKYQFPEQEWQAMQSAILDPEGSRTRLFAQDNENNVKVGDILRCSFKTGEPFNGVCLSIRRRGIDSAVLLRNRFVSVAAEMYVKIYSPNVKSIEIVQRAAKRARRARLYYMRKPKHDRGSVEGVVDQFLQRRRALQGGSADVQKKAKIPVAPAKAKAGTK